MDRDETTAPTHSRARVHGHTLERQQILPQKRPEHVRHQPIERLLVLDAEVAQHVVTDRHVARDPLECPLIAHAARDLARAPDPARGAVRALLLDTFVTQL